MSDHDELTRHSAAPKRKRGRPSAADIAAQLGETASVSSLPDGPADEHGLTPRQRRILEVIKAAVELRGYPPSIREMGEAVGLASSSSVAHQLRALEQKGFLRRDPNRPRGGAHGRNRTRGLHVNLCRAGPFGRHATRRDLPATGRPLRE